MYNYLIRRCGVLMLMMFAAGCAPGQVARVQGVQDVQEKECSSCAFGVDWSTVTAEEIAAIKGIETRIENVRTPLHYAAGNSENPAVIEVLLAAGADIEARDGAINNTPLHNAAWANKNPAVIEVLLAAGADIEARGGLIGNTPLHFAAWYNTHPAVIEVLLAAGANTDVRNEIMGFTPLHFAAWYNTHPAVIEALLAAGADAKAQDNTGKTPFYYAEKNDSLKGTDVYKKLQALQ